MEGVIDPMVSNGQPIVFNNESPCMEFSKTEDVISLDDRDDKSSDTNSSSSIIAEENGIGKLRIIRIFFLLWRNILFFINIKLGN
jgi:hypothetical protein